MADLITSHQAAAIYGCGSSNLTKMARRFGFTAVRTAHIVVGDGYRKVKLWNPADILELRKRVKITEAARRKDARRNPMKRPSVKRRVRTMQMERLRAYYQLPREQRTGIGAWMKITHIGA
jgi:hypothetical protein